MEKAYAIHISDPAKDKELVDILVGKGYELVTLPDNDILLVPKDAQETVKNAAFEAQEGSCSAFEKATGVKLNPEVSTSEAKVKSSASSIDSAKKLK
tara:strand:+ start:1687 stop:1977 length:291 start_codon:yes stop_codon:yes gene_type:complete